MRFIGILIIFLSIPAFIIFLRANPRYRKFAYFAIGFLPFGVTFMNVDAALISWSTWTGYSKGIIFSLLDTLALAVIVTARKPFSRLPLTGLIIAYMLTIVVSMVFSGVFVSSSFYLVQVLRLLLVFSAVATFASHLPSVNWLAAGLAVGAIWEAVVTIDQRLGGAVQASGTVGHQNLLGYMLHFVTLPLLAILLSGHKHKLIAIGVFASLVAVSLGASRGTIAFAALGVPLLLVLSIIRNPTPQKWRLVGLGLLVAAVVVPLTLSSLGQRFGSDGVSVKLDSERSAFERAAKEMLSDNPMGVGANQYVLVANTGGYNDRAGVNWNYSSRSGKVHNMYLLAGAETGWLGLISLLGVLGWSIALGLRFAYTNRRDPRGDLVLGCTVAIFICSLHGLYEWIFFMMSAQYMFAISLGIIAGCVRHRRSPGGRPRMQAGMSTS
jgi:O-antigen ligase